MSLIADIVVIKNNKNKKPKKSISSLSSTTTSNSTNSSIRIGRDPGRVKVFVRVRPATENELGKYGPVPYELQSEKNQVKIPADDRGHPEKTYSFDHVFTPEKKNEEVCDIMTPPLVDAAMSGFNGTLMAYGQTGSGKTYTLMSDNGITKSLIDQCFRRIQDDIKHSYKVTVSYLQIYQEKIYDLLANGNDKIDLTIREHPKTGVYVENLTEYVVRTPQEVMQFLAAGKKKLVFGETKMNRTSSRSHSVLQMSIEKTLKNEKEMKEAKKKQNKNIEAHDNKENEPIDLNSFGKDVIIRGKIHICDLAGSERIKKTGASGERLREAQDINSSLLELGNVIQALADEKTTHIPFRNSVLTRLLQESLGGNCKTSLVVCTSPLSRDLHETKCTLNFGSRAMKVTNTAYVNMEVDFKSLSDQLLKQLQAKEDEIFQLRESYRGIIEKECEITRKQVEESKQQVVMELELQKQMAEDKLMSVEGEICALENFLDEKEGRIQSLEDSMLSMDEMVRQERDIGYQMMKTENIVKNVVTSASPNMIKNVVRLTEMFEHYVEDMQSNYADDMLLNNFVCIQQNVADIDSFTMDDAEPTPEIIENVKARLEKLSKDISDENNNPTRFGENDTPWLRYNLFLGNAIHSLLQTVEYETLKDGCELLTDGCETLKEGCELLKRENERMKGQYDVLKDDNELVKEENDVLKEEKEILKEEKESLKYEIELLKEESDKLKEEFERCKEDYQRVKEESETLSEQLSKNDYQRMKEETEALKEQLQNAEALNEQLQNALSVDANLSSVEITDINHVPNFLSNSFIESEIDVEQQEFEQTLTASEIFREQMKREQQVTSERISVSKVHQSVQVETLTEPMENEITSDENVVDGKAKQNASVEKANEDRKDVSTSTTEEYRRMKDRETSTDKKIIYNTATQTMLPRELLTVKRDIGTQLYPAPVQTRDKCVQFDSKANRKLIDTTVEDIEKIITEIQSEDFTDRTDIRKSGEIFSGFSTLLGRIEGLVANDRRSRKLGGGVLSRLGVISPINDDILRPASSIFDKYDSKMIAYDQQDFSAKYKSGGRSLTWVADFDPYKNNAEDERNKHNGLVQQKYKELASVCQKLKQENSGFMTLIEQLTRLVPDKKLVDDIWRVIKNKKHQRSNGTQTEEIFDFSLKEDRGKSMKIAHVKPRVAEESTQVSAKNEMASSPFSRFDFTRRTISNDEITRRNKTYDENGRGNRSHNLDTRAINAQESDSNMVRDRSYDGSTRRNAIQETQNANLRNFLLKESPPKSVPIHSSTPKKDSLDEGNHRHGSYGDKKLKSMSNNDSTREIVPSKETSRRNVYYEEPVRRSVTEVNSLKSVPNVDKIDNMRQNMSFDQTSQRKIQYGTSMRRSNSEGSSFKTMPYGAASRRSGRYSLDARPNTSIDEEFLDDSTFAITSFTDNSWRNKSVDENKYKNIGSESNFGKSSPYDTNTVKTLPLREAIASLKSDFRNQHQSNEVMKNSRREVNVGKSSQSDKKSLLSESIANKNRKYSSIGEKYSPVTANKIDENEELHQVNTTVIYRDKSRAAATKERPQTWFGGRETYEMNKLNNSFSNNYRMPSRELGNNRNLDLYVEGDSSDDVVFSKARRSSWVLPDWMKTKRNIPSNVPQFIQ